MVKVTAWVFFSKKYCSLNNFCTYFDFNYLDRAKVLFESIENTCEQLKIFCLCLDQQSFDEINENYGENFISISLHELEVFEPNLLSVKKERSKKEYIFTLSPVILLYILYKYDIKEFTYVDADTYFFDSPKVVKMECGENDILITPHFFPDSLKNLEIHGVYNFGLMHVKNTANAHKALDWWKEKCLDWCFDKVEPGRYADQKYLDYLPDNFKKIKVSSNRGLNAGPWQIYKNNLSHKNGKYYINKTRLVHFHFHDIKYVSPYNVSIGFKKYDLTCKDILLDFYSQYIGKLYVLKKAPISNYYYEKDTDLIVFNNKSINKENIIYWNNLDPFVCCYKKMVYKPLDFIRHTTKTIVIIGTGKTARLTSNLIHIIVNKKILFSNTDQKEEDGNLIPFENLNVKLHFVIIGSSYVDEIKVSLEHLGFKINKNFVIPIFLN